MSLLQTITTALANQEPQIDQSIHPIIFNSNDILRNLNLQIDDSNEDQTIKRVEGWKISDIDTEIVELGNDFVKKLTKKRKNPNLFGIEEFLRLLKSFLEKIRAKVVVLVDVDGTSLSCVCVLIEKLGLFLGRDVVGLIVESCVDLGVWDVLETLIREGVVGQLVPKSLIEGVIRTNRSDLICLCVKHGSHVQSSDFLSILKYFLSPPKDAYSTMLVVRKEWEKEGLLAIEKATKKGVSSQLALVAKQASLLLMIAYDGFDSSELCMHYLFASSILDELALSYCASRLDGAEMVKLIRYFGKWLRKYERFPQVVPCPKAASSLNLKCCDFVPSLEVIVKCLGSVLDDQFSSLMLHSEYYEELRSIDEVVKSLTSEVRLYCSLADLVNNVRREVGPGDNV
ncbi:hypothetical protein Scep_028233 [Stephania cephalantha]|uniref:Uncharacterized protein n=1 Tax=Stephania cephalantha TaxID=152367 RepID=A0AAP0E9J5_9MAGN